MKDKGLDKGIIKELDDSKRSQFGRSKSFFGFRKMFRDYLTKLHVAFYDTCCEAASESGIYPVRWNESLSRLEKFDGLAWVDITQIVETTSTTTTTTSIS